MKVFIQTLQVVYVGIAESILILSIVPYTRRHEWYYRCIWTCRCCVNNRTKYVCSNSIMSAEQMFTKAQTVLTLQCRPQTATLYTRKLTAP
jgi:hypothetical protein